MSTAPSYASVALEKGATQRLGPVSVPQDTVVHPAGSVSSWTPKFYNPGSSYRLFLPSNAPTFTSRTEVPVSVPTLSHRKPGVLHRNAHLSCDP